MSAVQAVAVLETGVVVNDFYSREEYVQRRVGFLGRHPLYKILPKLFPMVRGDADEIYQPTDDKLSVQEVRRRELTSEITPLLPLPTTDNCESLDSFRSYPTAEWTPAASYPADGAANAPGGISQAVEAAQAPVSNASMQMPPDDAGKIRLILELLGRRPRNAGQQASQSPPLASPSTALSGRGMAVPVKKRRSPASDGDDDDDDDGSSSNSRSNTDGGQRPTKKVRFADGPAPTRNAK